MAAFVVEFELPSAVLGVEEEGFGRHLAFLNQIN